MRSAPEIHQNTLSNSESNEYWRDIQCLNRQIYDEYGVETSLSHNALIPDWFCDYRNPTVMNAQQIKMLCAAGMPVSAILKTCVISLPIFDAWVKAGFELIVNGRDPDDIEQEHTPAEKAMMLIANAYSAGTGIGSSRGALYSERPQSR